MSDPARRDVSDRDRCAHAALLEPAHARANQIRRQLPSPARGRQGRRVCAAAWRAASSPRRSVPGRQGSSVLTMASVHAGRQELGRLLRAHQRAGEDSSSSDTSRPSRPRTDFLESADAALGQRAFGVVGPLVAALGRNGVANQIEFHAPILGLRPQASADLRQRVRRRGASLMPGALCSCRSDRVLFHAVANVEQLRT